MGESVGLEEAVLAQTAAESSAVLLPPLAAKPLPLRLGGEDVHLALRVVFALRSELPGHGSEVKLLHTEFGSSGLCPVMSLSCDGASGGCDSQLH